MSALDIFQALCKFYSADHRIMQSGVLKYFQLRIDKKYLRLSWFWQFKTGAWLIVAAKFSLRLQFSLHKHQDVNSNEWSSGLDDDVQRNSCTKFDIPSGFDCVFDVSLRRSTDHLLSFPACYRLLQNINKKMVGCSPSGCCEWDTRYFLLLIPDITNRSWPLRNVRMIHFIRRLTTII